MSLGIDWTYSALAALTRIHWRTASDVDGAVQRFARSRALRLPSGRYHVRAQGYEIRVQVNHAIGTVLVLYFYQIPG